jgi:uncharacterized protein (DUF1501 family)
MPILADCETRRYGRRAFLGGGASLALWSLMPRIAAAGRRDPRLLTMVLRGGLDGLSLAAPVGDPDYARLRRHIAMQASGEKGALPLDGFFALNPNMPFLHGLYQRGQALIVHAVHTEYRGRSHFDGQDVLESGHLTGRHEDGWMNRALAGMPAAEKASPKGLALDAIVPLVMRGAAPVLSWIPKVSNTPLRDSTVMRLSDLYAATDPTLAKAFADGMAIDRVAMSAAAVPASAVVPAGGAPAPAPAARPFRDFTEAAEAAARFLSSADGPRIGALSYNGWDTHANEGVLQGTLANRLAGLDLALSTLHEGLGAAWAETVVLVLTEFGRTARVNGTDGTDHGAATVAILAGGAVRGGRVLSTWPGLKDTDLFEGRDLKPTMDLRAVLKGVLGDHLGVPAGVLARSVFPASDAVAPLKGLLA